MTAYSEASSKSDRVITQSDLVAYLASVDQAYEHAVVNFYPVPVGYLGPLSALGPPSFLLGPTEGYVWARFTVSEGTVPLDWDGSAIFEDGETEGDLLVIGASEEGLVRRAFFGDIPESIAGSVDGPVILVKPYVGHVKSWFQQLFGSRRPQM